MFNNKSQSVRVFNSPNTGGGSGTGAMPAPSERTELAIFNEISKKDLLVLPPNMTGGRLQSLIVTGAMKASDVYDLIDLHKKGGNSEAALTLIERGQLPEEVFNAHRVSDALGGLEENPIKTDSGVIISEGNLRPRIMPGTCVVRELVNFDLLERQEKAKLFRSGNLVKFKLLKEFAEQFGYELGDTQWESNEDLAIAVDKVCGLTNPPKSTLSANMRSLIKQSKFMERMENPNARDLSAVMDICFGHGAGED